MLETHFFSLIKNFHLLMLYHIFNSHSDIKYYHDSNSHIVIYTYQNILDMKRYKFLVLANRFPLPAYQCDSDFP